MGLSCLRDRCAAALGRRHPGIRTGSGSGLVDLNGVAMLRLGRSGPAASGGFWQRCATRTILDRSLQQMPAGADVVVLAAAFGDAADASTAAGTEALMVMIDIANARASGNTVPATGRGCCGPGSCNDGGQHVRRAGACRSDAT